MKKESFERLVKMVSNFVLVENVKNKCYIYLYYISNASTYRVLRNIIGHPKSTICKIVDEWQRFFTTRTQGYFIPGSF
jgi:hypothetical protein